MRIIFRDIDVDIKVQCFIDLTNFSSSVQVKHILKNNQTFLITIQRTRENKRCKIEISIYYKL